MNVQVTPRRGWGGGFTWRVRCTGCPWALVPELRTSAQRSHTWQGWRKGLPPARGPRGGHTGGRGRPPHARSVSPCPAAVANFFSASCVPCADGARYPNLCRLCAGAGEDKCACSSKEPYFGYSGAFR